MVRAFDWRSLVHVRDPIDNSPLSCFDVFGKRRTKENEQKKLGPVSPGALQYLNVECSWTISSWWVLSSQYYGIADGGNFIVALRLWNRLLERDSTLSPVNVAVS